MKNNRLQKRRLGQHDRWMQEARAALLQEALDNAEGPEFDGTRYSPCMTWKPIVFRNPRLRLVKNIHITRLIGRSGFSIVGEDSPDIPFASCARSP